MFTGNNRNLLLTLHCVIHFFLFNIFRSIDSYSCSSHKLHRQRPYPVSCLGLKRRVREEPKLDEEKLSEKLQNLW